MTAPAGPRPAYQDITAGMPDYHGCNPTQALTRMPTPPTNPAAHPIARLTLRQYKSIERCDIELGPFTILAGRNGAGKSNIIDALAFVSDALRNTLEYALRKRGGITQVRRKSPSKPTVPAIGIQLRLPDGNTAKYAFRITTVKGPQFRVDQEECRITDASGRVLHEFLVRDRDVQRWTPPSARPALAEDRLYLVAVSGLPEFRPVYDTLTRMVFHNFNPEVMKRPQQPEPGPLLSHDGGNLASVIKHLAGTAPEKLERVLEYIREIGVPLKNIEHKQSGSLETLEVIQERGEEGRPASFDAIALSDGTIRALGILVSLVSLNAEGTRGPSLIGIEEPETALHPAAAGALMDALAEGSESTQLLITCHSPDLLDSSAVSPDMIRPVVLEEGRTRVGVLSQAKSDLLTKHLSTAGELLRLDQLQPDEAELRAREEAAGTLFEAFR